jgi:hypothetical protein
MRNASGLNGIGESARDVLLPNHVGKRLGPPFSRDDLVAHTVKAGASKFFVNSPCPQRISLC